MCHVKTSYTYGYQTGHPNLGKGPLSQEMMDYIRRHLGGKKEKSILGQTMYFTLVSLEYSNSWSLSCVSPYSTLPFVYLMFTCQQEQNLGVSPLSLQKKKKKEQNLSLYHRHYLSQNPPPFLFYTFF
jgi:hypothetical protein